jgi:hypothetical protein
MFHRMKSFCLYRYINCRFVLLSLSDIADHALRTVYTRTLNNPNSPSSEQISFVGKVIKRAEVLPVENEQYMLMKRKQFEGFQEPTRKAVMIVKKVHDYAPRRDHEINKKESKLKKTMGKRIRSSEETVLPIMFTAFAKNQYISMSGLESITRQPKQFLQQLVKKYCNYNNAVSHCCLSMMIFYLIRLFLGTHV